MFLSSSLGNYYKEAFYLFKFFKQSYKTYLSYLSSAAYTFKLLAHRRIVMIIKSLVTAV